MKHVKCRVNLEISKYFSVILKIFYCSLFLYLHWVLKRTVSLSTYNLPMLWLDPHLYEKGSFYAHTLPATEGGFIGAVGERVLFLVRIPSALVLGGIGHE